MFKRWAIVFKHDASPVDGALFTHKFAAEKLIKQMKNPSKFRTAQMKMVEVR